MTMYFCKGGAIQPLRMQAFLTKFREKYLVLISLGMNFSRAKVIISLKNIAPPDIGSGQGIEFI